MLYGSKHDRRTSSVRGAGEWILDERHRFCGQRCCTGSERSHWSGDGGGGDGHRSLPNAQRLKTTEKICRCRCRRCRHRSAYRGRFRLSRSGSLRHLVFLLSLRGAPGSAAIVVAAGPRTALAARPGAALAAGPRAALAARPGATLVVTVEGIFATHSHAVRTGGVTSSAVRSGTDECVTHRRIGSLFGEVRDRIVAAHHVVHDM
mmetsp:Transcript_16157/g.48527  ORF Transcript_16157/g.48527 Transcript_16157/m.48527 type:complete len:205 (-) Transcript_16157:2034-2648(-)